MPVALILLVYPLLEIAALVLLGGRIGVLGVLLWILASGFAGVLVLRDLARGEGPRLRRAGPAGQLAEALILALAGVLLILPGPLGDGLGLVMLIPWVRRGVIGLGLAGLAGRFGPIARAAGAGQGHAWGRGQAGGEGVIEVEYEVLDQREPRQGGGRGPSPWA